MRVAVTIGDALNQAIRKLKNSATPELDAAVLLEHCCAITRTRQLAFPETVLDEKALQKFYAAIERRIAGEPVAHITGTREFWSLNLQTNNSTLIPRPDTELLVETALPLINDDSQCHVLDLGTGTGAIALAIATERRTTQIIACDNSAAACELANINRTHLQLDNVRIVESNWFTAIEQRNFDVIVSNPPYLDLNDEHLLIGDVRFEPHSALTADEHGMADLNHIIEQAVNYLRPGGYLLLEHGFEQAGAVRDKLRQAGYSDIFTNKDLAGHERVSGGKLE